MVTALYIFFSVKLIHKTDIPRLRVESEKSWVLGYFGFVFFCQGAFL